jgi:hypothetical protein
MRHVIDMPHNLEGNATDGLHGGDMRANFGDRHPDTNKREGRCLVGNIHLITPYFIKTRLAFGHNQSELAFFFTKKSQPLFDFRVR